MKNLESEIMGSLIIKDPIYGEFEINEPVLIELINSKPLQRLKKIWQHGLPEKYYFMKTFTRYDHSIGVFLLLRKLNARLEEQIAGLLHDVSHTAFSHVADFLFKNIDENYQDSILEEFLLNTEIPGILNKYNYELSDVLEGKNKFYLLENNAPDICADRIDYTLRELVQTINFEDAIYCYNNLIVLNNNIIFGNLKSAELFAKYYSLMERQHWGSVDNMVRYELTANVLRFAIDKKIILLEDLHKDDQYVIDKLLLSKEKYIQDNLKIIFKIINFEICDANFDFHLQKKFRYVDPKFLDSDTKVKRYSDVNPKYLADLLVVKQNHEKGYKIKLIN